MGKAYNLQQMSNNTNQQFKVMVDSLTKNGRKDNRNRHRWMWIMNYLDWYTHCFHFVGDDELESQKAFIIEKLFWNGVCAVVRFGEQPIVVGIKNIKRGLNGYIISAEVEEPNRSEVLSVKDLDLTNAVFFQANVYSWGLFIGLDEYITPMLELWEIMPMEIQNAVTKILFKIDTDDVKERQSIIKEIDKMYERVGSLIQVVSNKLGSEIQIKTETITEKLQELFKFYRNYGFQMTGRIFNASEKRERNITSEVAVNQLQFLVPRNSYLYFIKVGVENYNKMFNKNVEVKPLQELEEERAMEMQQINMLHQGLVKDKDKENENED